MADLRQAELQGADITRATIGWTIFVFADLGDVDGFSSVNHEGPSFLGIESIESIYRSRRNLPNKFLPFLLSKPIHMYSCFISYSTKDRDFAERFHADLQVKGVRCWFSPHDMQAGKKLHDQIDKAIRLSGHSMNS